MGEAECSGPVVRKAVGSPPPASWYGSSSFGRLVPIGERPTSDGPRDPAHRMAYTQERWVRATAAKPAATPRPHVYSSRMDPRVQPRCTHTLCAGRASSVTQKQATCCERTKK